MSEDFSIMLGMDGDMFSSLPDSNTEDVIFVNKNHNMLSAVHGRWLVKPQSYSAFFWQRTNTNRHSLSRIIVWVLITSVSCELTPVRSLTASMNIVSIIANS